MASRHLSRSVAMQSLYEWDFKGRKGIDLAAISKRNIKEFLRNVIPSFHDRFDKFNKDELPSLFIKCDSYSSEVEESEEESEVEDPDHYLCINCINGFKLKGFTPEEFYHKYSKSWEDEFPSYKNPRAPIPESSKARQVSNKEEIYIARDGNYGIQVNILNINDNESFDFTPALFYFKKLEELDKSKLQDIKSQIQKEKRLTKERSNKLWKEEQDNARKIRLEKLNKIFKK